MRGKVTDFGLRKVGYLVSLSLSLQTCASPTLIT